MHVRYFLLVTAIIEVGTGLLLLFLPAVPVGILLGVDDISVEANICARVAGGALLAIGVACWYGRSDERGPSQSGLLVGALIYDMAAALILVYSGLHLNLAGIALWPVVVLHSALAGWAMVCSKHQGRGASAATLVDVSVWMRTRNVRRIAVSAAQPVKCHSRRGGETEFRGNAGPNGVWARALSRTSKQAS